MPSPWKKFLCALADETGDILLKHFRRIRHVERKPGAGIVTEADKRAEKHILGRIFRNFPESSIITEESGEFRRSDELCWIIDPLDGTSNYAHGFPWFCVSVGLQVNGELTAGVVYHPTLGEMFYAERGKGAWLGDRRIRVSGTRQLSDALLGTGFYYARGRKLAEEIELFRRMNQLCLGVRRPGAAALDLAYVACGRYDGFWERGLSPWDVAAGVLLVEEAGGRVSRYDGKPTTLFEREMLASNGILHRKLTNVLQGRKRT